MKTKKEAATKPRKDRPGRCHSEEEQLMIFAFLAAREDEAIEAEKQCAETARAVPDAPGVQQQLIYWRNVLSAIRWMAHRVPQRQRYLADVRAKIAAQKE